MIFRSRNTPVNDSGEAWRTRPADAAGSPRSESGEKEDPSPTLTVRPSRRSAKRELNSAPKRATPIEPPSERKRSEEHTSELQSLMRISYAVFCLTKKNTREKKSHS